jgi:hypothetical protein
VQDFCTARQKHRAAFSGGIEVVHGIPVLRSGVLDGAGSVAVRDAFKWITQVSLGWDISVTSAHFTTSLGFATSDDSSLMSSEAAGLSLTPAAGTAMLLAAVSYHVMLPTNIEKKDVAAFELVHTADFSGGAVRPGGWLKRE